MLVTFEARSHPRITFFGDVAETLLKLMNQSGAVPGALVPEDVQAAREALERAVAAEDPPRQPAADADEDSDAAVSIRHRALPLIELLAAAAAAGEHVTWTQGRTPP